jgi:5-methylcytosine-specific restriction endonuclease McrA
MIPYWQQRRDRKLTGEKATKKVVKKAAKDDLTGWFAHQLTMCTPDCENCKTKFTSVHIINPRTIIAHILPKRSDFGFPEVATHPFNRMFLCPDCHSKYDNGNAADREKMPVYATALARYAIFKDLLPINRLSKAEKYLGI